MTQKLSLYMEQDGNNTTETGVTKSINNFLSILMCTYIKLKNEYIQIHTIQYRNNFSTKLFTLFTAETFNIPK